MSQAPLVFVITSNYARYLPDCVSSVLDQITQAGPEAKAVYKKTPKTGPTGRRRPVVC